MQLPSIDCLSPAELRVVRSYAQNQSRAATARELGLSQTTVRRLLQNAYGRLAQVMSERERDYWLRPVGRPRNIRLGSLSDIVNV